MPSVETVEKLIALAASPNPHEADAAARKACEQIRANGYRVIDPSAAADVGGASTIGAAPTVDASPPPAARSFWEEMIAAVVRGVRLGEQINEAAERVRRASAHAAEHPRATSTATPEHERPNVHEDDEEEAEGRKIGWWIVTRGRYVAEHKTKRAAWKDGKDRAERTEREHHLWKMDPDLAKLETDDGTPLRVPVLAAIFRPR